MRAIRTIAFLILAAPLGGCWSGAYEDPAAPYVNRSDTITLSAGNAKDVNAATHVIDPWPRYVGERQVPADGERMSGAVERYKRPAAKSPGQPGQPGGPGGQPPPPSGAAAPAATLPY